MQIINNIKQDGKTPIYWLLLKETGMNSKRNADIGNLALNVDIAIRQEQNINQDIKKCHGLLTSNIGKVISDIKRKVE